MPKFAYHQGHSTPATEHSQDQVQSPTKEGFQPLKRLLKGKVNPEDGKKRTFQARHGSHPYSCPLNAQKRSRFAHQDKENLNGIFTSKYPLLSSNKVWKDINKARCRSNTASKDTPEMPVIQDVAVKRCLQALQDKIGCMQGDQIMMMNVQYELQRQIMSLKSNIEALNDKVLRLGSSISMNCNSLNAMPNPHRRALYKTMKRVMKETKSHFSEVQKWYYFASVDYIQLPILLQVSSVFEEVKLLIGICVNSTLKIPPTKMITWYIMPQLRKAETGRISVWDHIVKQTVEKSDCDASIVPRMLKQMVDNHIRGFRKKPMEQNIAPQCLLSLFERISSEPQASCSSS